MIRERIILAIAATLLLASCGHAPAGPAQTRWTLTASPSVNADAHGRPAPLVVRLYALSARDAFDRATFFELYDRDRTVLEQTAVERRVLVLKPGEHLRLAVPLDARTRAFAVVAAYQRIDSATWRAVVDFDPTASSRDGVLAACFGASVATLELKHPPQHPRKRAGSGAQSAIGRWIEPIWKKLAGSMNAG